jgi:hypothetical protein
MHTTGVTERFMSLMAEMKASSLAGCAKDDSALPAMYKRLNMAAASLLIALPSPARASRPRSGL